MRERQSNFLNGLILADFQRKLAEAEAQLATAKADEQDWQDRWSNLCDELDTILDIPADSPASKEAAVVEYAIKRVRELKEEREKRRKAVEALEELHSRLNNYEWEDDGGKGESILRLHYGEHFDLQKRVVEAGIVLSEAAQEGKA